MSDTKSMRLLATLFAVVVILGACSSGGDVVGAPEALATNEDVGRALGAPEVGTSETGRSDSLLVDEVEIPVDQAGVGEDTVVSDADESTQNGGEAVVEEVGDPTGVDEAEPARPVGEDGEPIDQEVSDAVLEAPSSSALDTVVSLSLIHI